MNATRRDNLACRIPMRACTWLTVATLALSACTNDLDAPWNYQGGTAESGDSGGGVLDIDCGTPPPAAVGATFAHTVTAMGGDGAYTFGGTLPDGLAIDPASGSITGVPTMAGAASLELTVTDGSGGMGTQSCPLPIAEHVDVDLALEAVPYCITGAPGDTLQQAIVPGTGDGSPITCDHPGGSGTGDMPQGISLDPDTCEVSGSVTESRYGTWAFMVRGQQSGADVWIPYCVSNTTQGTFTITADHSGRTDNALEPLMRLFDPAQAVFAGDANDPIIRVVDPGACEDGSCNFFGFSFFINASAFDIAPDVYDDDGDGDTDEGKPIVVDGALFDDANGDAIGLSHGLRLNSNAPIGAPLDARTWIVNLDLDYCLGNNNGDCPENDISGSADGFFVFSVIMVPQP